MKLFQVNESRMIDLLPLLYYYYPYPIFPSSIHSYSSYSYSSLSFSHYPYTYIYIIGLGVAKQRKAIVDGLRDVVNDFSSHVQGSSAQEVMDLLLLTQYFDVMKEISKKPGTTGNSIFLPHGPNAIKALREDLKNSITTAKKN